LAHPADEKKFLQYRPRHQDWPILTRCWRATCLL